MEPAFQEGEGSQICRAKDFSWVFGVPLTVAIIFLTQPVMAAAGVHNCPTHFTPRGRLTLAVRASAQGASLWRL